MNQSGSGNGFSHLLREQLEDIMRYLSARLVDATGSEFRTCIANLEVVIREYRRKTEDKGSAKLLPWPQIQNGRSHRH